MRIIPRPESTRARLSRPRVGRSLGSPRWRGRLRWIRHWGERRLLGLRLIARARFFIAGVLTLLATFLSCGAVSAAAGPAVQVTVQLSPASILADGRSTSTVTATVTDASGTP